MRFWIFFIRKNNGNNLVVIKSFTIFAEVKLHSAI